MTALSIWLLPSAAWAEPPCETVCARLIACARLGAKEKRPRAECERSCAAQVAASAVVAEQVRQIVARCAPLPDCEPLAECIKRVPAKYTPGRGIETLLLPLPPEIARRWLALECTAVKKYGDRLGELRGQPTPPADLIALDQLSKLIQAMDATGIATLTETAWRKCPPGK
jgi:hypothetical protein